MGAAATIVLSACSLLVGTNGLDDRTDLPLDGGADAPPDSVREAPIDVALADAGVEAAASDTSCPESGVMMVNVGAGYCIDSTEVTVGQYQQFLATTPDPSLQSPACLWNLSFAPGAWDTSKTTYPVANVDWCDALAFCESVGKRLCGKVGGGAVDLTSLSDPTLSQWELACSHSGALTYPYGNVLDTTACNDVGVDAGVTAPAGSFSKCAGGYAGIFDMSGNVSEWIDSCADATGASDVCGESSSSYASGVDDCTFNTSDRRDTQRDSLGFRCCSP